MNRYYEADKQMSAEMAAEFGEGWLPPKPTIEITQPDAMPGDEVEFLNYRTKIDPHQIGKVVQVETRWMSLERYAHIYTVKPDRRNYWVRVKEVRKL